MPRPTDGPVKRDKLVSFRVTPATRRTIDAQRGGLSVSEYFRRLVIADARRNPRSGG